MKRSFSPSTLSRSSKRGKVGAVKYEDASLAEARNMMLVLFKSPGARGVPIALISMISRFLLVVIPPLIPIRASLLERRRRLTAIQALLHGPAQTLLHLEERMPGCIERMTAVMEQNKASLKNVTRPALLLMCAKLFLTREDRLGLVCRPSS